MGNSDTLTNPRTINEIFASAAKRHRKENAFSYKKDGTWVAVSHQVFIDQVRETRAGFLELGLQRGDRVGLLSENRLEWTITDLALLSCGGINVPIYATSTAGQVNYILNDSGAKFLCLSNAKQLDKVVGALGGLPNLKTLIVFDDVPTPANLPSDVRLMKFTQLRDLGRRAAAEGDFMEQLVAAAAPEDLATLIYTSGTTGEPKGVMLTHNNITSNMLAGFERINCGPEDIALSYLPLSHIFERTVMYGFIFGGVSVYFAESVDAVAKNLGEVQPTLMTSVPRVFEKILARIEDEVSKTGGLKASMFAWAMRVAKECHKADNYGRSVSSLLKLQHKLAYKLVLSKVRAKIAPRVRFFNAGGAALAEDLAYSFAAMGLPILQGYGLTETSPVITVNSLTANRYGTVGKPIRGCEVKIAEDGEILAKGPNIMMGYYNRPEATAEVIKDGWFHTGDIGHLDADGFLKITDRKKDLFKTSGGKYIAPQPIENLLTMSHYIAQAVVVGNERKFPAALVIPNLDALKKYAGDHGITFKTTAELLANDRINAFMMKEVERMTPELANYEKLKKIALLENELSIDNGELTPTLKIKRRVVDERYKAVIEKLYEEKTRAAGAE